MVFAGGDQRDLTVDTAVIVEVAAQRADVLIFVIVSCDGEKIISPVQSLGQFKTEAAVTAAMLANILPVQPDATHAGNGAELQKHALSGDFLSTQMPLIDTAAHLSGVLGIPHMGNTDAFHFLRQKRQFVSLRGLSDPIAPSVSQQDLCSHSLLLPIL